MMTRSEIGWAVLFVVLMALTLAPVIERAKSALMFFEMMQRGL